jgi:hypothetical protein
MKQFFSWLSSRKFSLGIFTFGILLLGKFLAPLFLFDVPLGYDPGIYRYLFLQYAESIRHFSLPELAPWALEYPPGLFVLAAPLLIAGLPVDVLIGWMWNLVPVLLACVLAWVMYKREGRAVGVCVLLIALLSQAYFDGFFAMYYKVYVSLILTVCTYHFAEKLSMWFIPCALAAVMIHQQTGLILTLALGIWWILSLKTRWKDPVFRKLSVALVVSAVIALLWYLPQWERAIWSPLKSIILLRGDNAPAGAFPDASFYVRTMGIVLMLGIFGMIINLRKERGSLWQLSVLVCAIFIIGKLVFYKRFYLQLDFFLMPFAAIALVWIWKHASTIWARAFLVLVLVVQAIVGLQSMKLRTPIFGASELSQIKALAEVIEPDAAVIAMENISGMWLRGWLPSHAVGAPGLFDYPDWKYEDWEVFIDGSRSERRSLLGGLQGPVYFFLSPTFIYFYGDRAKLVIEDPCLTSVSDAPLLLSVCSKD